MHSSKKKAVELGLVHTPTKSDILMILIVIDVDADADDDDNDIFERKNILC